MPEFKEIPASKILVSRRKMLYSIGVNDAVYVTQPTIDGVLVSCPYYRRWRIMMTRCYSNKTQEKQPTYKGCSVCSEWLTFSSFKSWMIKQDWKGNDLDKDIIKPGNKVYCPDFCAFVDKKLNYLLNNCKAARGDLPQGVYFEKLAGKFRARISVNCKQVCLGLYPTPDEASAVYLKAKRKMIITEANKHKDKRVSKGLRLHAKLLG